MANYTVLRTDTADSLIHQLILDIAEKFGADVALNKLNDLEEQILLLENNPYLGVDPRYITLRRQHFKVLITDKNLIFYKINESNKTVTIYAVIDQRKDYLNIINGL